VCIVAVLWRDLMTERSRWLPLERELKGLTSQQDSVQDDPPLYWLGFAGLNLLVAGASTAQDGQPWNPLV
jgi:hypothetical protein